VADGGAAVAAIRRGVLFDAVLSDITMPSMDGIQLLREIREYDLFVPVVLMTGEPAVSTAVKAVEYGAFHYLTKPVAMDELHRVLGRAAALSRMARVKHEAAAALGAAGILAADRAGLEASFERASVTSGWPTSHRARGRPRRVRLRGPDSVAMTPRSPGRCPCCAPPSDWGGLPDLGRTVRERVVERSKGCRRGASCSSTAPDRSAGRGALSGGRAAVSGRDEGGAGDHGAR
jgi:CheY-like chemotaxis protein